MIFEVISPEYYTPLKLIFAFLCLSIAICALVFGKTVERIGGWFLTISIGLHVLFGAGFWFWPNGIRSVDLVLGTVDLAMFLALGIRSHRFWPIIASGCLLLRFVIMTLQFIGEDVGIFGQTSILYVLWGAVPLLLFCRITEICRRS